MKTGYVFKDPHNEMTKEQLGGVAETFVKGFWITKGYIPKKLCQYDKERGQLKLLIDNAKHVILKSTIEEKKKIQLMEYLEQNIRGLPDFIVLTPDKDIIFFEVKYNGSWASQIQKRRHQELEAMGYKVSVERIGKITPAPRTLLGNLKDIMNRLIFWRKSRAKWVTTHQIG